MFFSSMQEWWQLNGFWEKPEDKFEKHLRKNPIHPFHETEEEFVLTVRNSKFYVGIFMFLTSSLGGAIYWLKMQTFSNELFDTTFILFFLWSIRLITYNWQTRRITIEKDGLSYYFYLNNTLVFQGDIHNIYLRLRAQSSSNGSMYYRLVLNGYNVEEQEITTMTKNKQKLEKLAKKLAFKMNINYFDSEDLSISHIVRHANPNTFYSKPSIKKQKSRPTRMSITRTTLDAFY